MVEMLLNNIISPNIQFIHGQYPLDFAIQSENLDMVRVLLYNGADPNLSKESFLNKAVKSDNIDIVNELLRWGINPNRRYGMFGPTSLFSLNPGSVNRVKIAKMLINAGADITLRNESGRTLLNYFALMGDYDMVEFFLGLGMDPNDRNNGGATSLLSAFNRYPNPEIIKLLIKFGADPNIPNNSGITPFNVLEHRRYQLNNYQELLYILNSFVEFPTIKEPES